MPRQPALSLNLVENRDFSSQLLLNKIANGQLRSESGKTITMAGIANAARLDANAKALGSVAANVATGVVLAEGAQGLMTEIRAQVQKLGELAQSGATSGVSNVSNYVNMTLQPVVNSINTLLQSQVDGVQVLGAGAGTTRNIVVDTNGNSVTVGGLDLNTSGTKLNTALTSLSSITDSSGLTTLASTAADAVDELSGRIQTQGAQTSFLKNRADSLNDMIASHTKASLRQVVTAGGSASSLLHQLGNLSDVPGV